MNTCGVEEELSRSASRLSKLKHLKTTCIQFLSCQAPPHYRLPYSPLNHQCLHYLASITQRPDCVVHRINTRSRRPGAPRKKGETSTRHISNRSPIKSLEFIFNNWHSFKRRRTFTVTRKNNLFTFFLTPKNP